MSHDSSCLFPIRTYTQKLICFLPQKTKISCWFSLKQIQGIWLQKKDISQWMCCKSPFLSIVYSVALRWSAMSDVFFVFVSDVSHARVWGDSDGKICGFEVIKHDKTLDFFTFFFDVNQVALCLNLQNTSKYAALRRWAAFKWHRWDFAKRGVCRRLLMFFWVSWKGCNEQNKYIIIIAYVIWYYIKIIGTLGFQSNYSGFWSFVLSRNVKFVFFLHQWLPNRWRESIFISISTCQKLVYWRRKGFARSLIPFYMQWTMQDSNLVWCWTYKQHQTSAHAFQRSKQLIPKYPK